VVGIFVLSTSLLSLLCVRMICHSKLYTLLCLFIIYLFIYLLDSLLAKWLGFRSSLDTLTSGHVERCDCSPMRGWRVTLLYVFLHDALHMRLLADVIHLGREHVLAREPTRAPRQITWRKQRWQKCESAPEFDVKYPQLHS
jgi:hypothetical protein